MQQYQRLLVLFCFSFLYLPIVEALFLGRLCAQETQEPQCSGAPPIEPVFRNPRISNLPIVRRLCQRYIASEDSSDTPTTNPTERTVSLERAFELMRPSFLWPTPFSSADTDITNSFGPRLKFSEGNRYDWHRGIDIKGEIGDDIIAVYPGIVADLSNYSSGGLAIVIEHEFNKTAIPANVTFHNKIISKWYSYNAHLNERLVVEGQSVQAGEVIGRMGQTGATTFTHLHYELRVGSRCSLENALENPTYTCNTFNFDPHVNPLFSFPFTECSALKAEIIQTPNQNQEGIVRVSGSRRNPDVNRFDVKLMLDDNMIVLEHTLDLNLRLGYNSSTTDALDTPDTSKPYLDPKDFGSFTGDFLVRDLVIPTVWIGPAKNNPSSVFVVTVSNIWKDTTVELKFGDGESW